MLALMGYIIIDDGHDVGFSLAVKKFFNTFCREQGVDLSFPLVSIQDRLAQVLSENFSRLSTEMLSKKVEKQVWDVLQGWCLAFLPGNDDFLAFLLFMAGKDGNPYAQQLFKQSKQIVDDF